MIYLPQRPEGTKKAQNNQQQKIFASSRLSGEKFLAVSGEQQ